MSYYSEHQRRSLCLTWRDNSISPPIRIQALFLKRVMAALREKLTNLL